VDRLNEAASAKDGDAERTDVRVLGRDSGMATASI